MGLVIDWVKGSEEVVMLEKEYEGGEGWIMDGLGGKKEVGREVIGEGFYVCLGKK